MEKRLLMFMVGLFLSVGTILAQTKVSGLVVSAEDDEPVIGASIRVQGTNLGTTTDIEGNFYLDVPSGKDIVVTYVGMQSVTVAPKSHMIIKLQPDAQSLEEVIVTGYGNFKKSTFTGAASTLNTQKLEDVPVMSVTDKLAGGVPGVTITSNSATPGAMNSIRVRGMGSINAGNNPLFVIDGTPMSSDNMSEFGYSDAGTNPLATINSNDIESVTVIKDAAAASLYGSRAANGVIVITTKSGKSGKTSVDFRSDWGFSKLGMNYRPTLSGPDRRAVLYAGLQNFGQYGLGMSLEEAKALADEEIDGVAAMPTTGWTNWKDLIFKTGHHQNYQVNVSGGNDKTKFYASLAYTDQEGILMNNGLERYTGNANITHKFGKFALNVNSMLSKMEQNVVNEGTGYSSMIFNYAMLQNPSSYCYDEEGNLVGDGFLGVNPIYEAQHSSDVNVVRRALNSAKLAWNIWDNLFLSEKVTYDYMDGTEDVLWDKQSNDGAPGGVVQRIKNSNEQLNTQTQLAYNKVFGLNNIDALLGFETEDRKYAYNYMSGESFPGELYELVNAGETSCETGSQQSKLVSYLGRVNYNYNDTYYLGASFRTDGSSRLARANRWGNFWSLSGSWRFTHEPFMASVKNVLTDGRVRLSYGVNGTQPSDYYAYMNVYKYGEIYNGESGMGIVGVGNPDLKWEKNKSFNVGLDLTFFKKYSVVFDYYTRTTSDLIYDMPISAIPGYFKDESSISTPYNIGSLRNNGFEMTITANWINNSDFYWSTSLNMGHNHNKVIKLNGETDQVVSGNLIHKVGLPYYSYYGYEYAGVDPATGAELYYINDGTENARNTTTNAQEANKTALGDAEATIQGGITNNLKWKFIDLGFTFTYQIGGDAYDAASWQQSNGSSMLYGCAVPTYYKLSEMWSGEGDTSCTQPKFQYGSSSVGSSRWMMPLDYLRLKSLSLGFTAPSKYLSQFGISKARAYVSASNLFTVKSSKLYVDPEVPVHGICYFETPALRTVTFGIELGF